MKECTSKILEFIVISIVVSIVLTVLLIAAYNWSVKESTYQTGTITNKWIHDTGIRGNDYYFELDNTTIVEVDMTEYFTHEIDHIYRYNLNQLTNSNYQVITFNSQSKCRQQTDISSVVNHNGGGLVNSHQTIFGVI